jgi:DNA helicase-2/ATP-dependent DNA helicase PcrA
LEESVFPHARIKDSEAELEEERRLCYVAITRAERNLYLTHAMRRRVYGTELPAEPSRFLNEFPPALIQDLSPGPSWLRYAGQGMARSNEGRGDEPKKRASNYQGRTYNNAESVREFFMRKEKKINPDAFGSIGSAESETSSGGSELRAGVRVRHAKYGQGLIVKREGEGDNAKLTINFQGYGVKKMIEKYAGLERA